jgi:hypothetical protein
MPAGAADDTDMQLAIGADALQLRQGSRMIAQTDFAASHFGS